MGHIVARSLTPDGQVGYMQLLLIRHALPLRSEPGEGSDPELSEAGLEQARRRPDAVDRGPDAPWPSWGRLPLAGEHKST